MDEPETETVRLAEGLLGHVLSLAASPDGATVAAAAHDGRLLAVDVASGQVTELAASDDGAIDGLSWSPDSAWLAWSQPGSAPLRRIRVARIADGEVIDVTDGRFADTDPVFTADGLYLAFVSRRSFDPVYDAQTFDLSFPFGSRPYLVPLAARDPVAVRPAARWPSGGPGSARAGQGQIRFTRTGRGIRRRRRPCRPRGGRAGDRGQVLRSCARSRAAWPGCASRSPGCSARAAPARTTTRRARPWSGSTCASARSPSWWASWTGSTSAATAPGSWSVTTMSCGSLPSERKDDRRLGRDGHRRPVPGQVPGRPGRAVAARLRRGRAAHAPGLLDPGHVRGGLGRRARRLPAAARPDPQRGRFHRPDVGGVRRARHVARLRDRGRQRPAGPRPGGPARRGHLARRVRPLGGGPGAAGRVVRPAGALAAGRAGRRGPSRRRAGRGGRAAGRPATRPLAAAGRHGRQAGRAHHRSRSPPIPRYGAGSWSCRCATTGGCATRTGWPGGAAWSASSATGGSATCTSRT